MGRHTVGTRAGPRRLLVIGAILVGAILIGVAGAAAFSGRLGTTLAIAPPCDDERTELTVVADPAIAPVVEEVAASAGGCETVRVRSESSADTAAVLASGAGADAEIWIPDSSSWVTRMTATAASLGRSAPAVGIGEVVATSPIVFAASASQAAGFSSARPAWSSLLAERFPAVLPDPEASAPSLVALAALQREASPTDRRQFAGAMIRLGRTIPDSTEEALRSVLAARTPQVVITAEHTVATWNTEGESQPLVALYPEEGTPALRFPFLRIGGAAGSDAGSALERALLDADDALAAYGLRRADGSGELDVPGVIDRAGEPLPEAKGSVQMEILRSWGVVALRSRMLAVIDVSGSMAEPAADGLRRIDVFQQAAKEAVAGFSEEVELGVRVFSTDRPTGTDWEDLAPIAPLGDPDHARSVDAIIDSLPSRLGGDTGLYDTTLDAVQEVRDGYDPEKVNTVLVITDGRNDDASSIDIDTLLTELEQTADPLRPVQVIMIGFGPDTDIDSMRRIAQATGGAAYTAERPQDLGLVLIDALSQRTCRPDC